MLPLLLLCIQKSIRDLRSEVDHSPTIVGVTTRALFLIAKINERSTILLENLPIAHPRETALLSSKCREIRRIHQLWVVAINGVSLAAEECTHADQLSELRNLMVRYSELLEGPCNKERELMRIVEEFCSDHVKNIFNQRYRRLGWPPVRVG